jgi:hypothetical protein
MHRWQTRAILIMILGLLISGCAFWDGFTRVLSDEANLETAGEYTGAVVRDSVPLLPSPWREIIVGCLSAVTGWVASAKKRRVR